MLGVPTQSADLMAVAKRRAVALNSIDYLGAGGAKRPAAQVAELKAAFPNAAVATGWGMTETNANGIGLVGDEYLLQPGAAGRLYAPVQEIAFLDDDGMLRLDQDRFLALQPIKRNPVIDNNSFEPILPTFRTATSDAGVPPFGGPG